METVTRPTGERRFYFNGWTEDEKLMCSAKTHISLFGINFCGLEDAFIEMISDGQQNGHEICSEDHRIIKSLSNCRINCDSCSFSSVSWCDLPCAVDQTDGLIYSGLCNVMRQLLIITKEKHPKNPDFVNILGHKDNCLKACEHVSPWTTFCESKIPTFLDHVLNNQSDTVADEKIVISGELLSFEENFSQRVSVPVYNKLLRRLRKEGVIDPDCKEVPHLYAESSDMMITDIIMFPCVHLYLDKHRKHIENLRLHLPRTLDWYKRMCSQQQIIKASNKMGYKLVNVDESSTLDVPKINYVLSSDRYVLSKRFREKVNERWKLKEDDIKPTLQKLKDAEIYVQMDTNCNHIDVKLDWESLPRDVNPMSGDLPAERIERKCQQIENLAVAVQNIAKPGDRIVDFCSGGGHLGILLAYLLPECHVILIENKEESVWRANKRIQQLKLKNVTQFQCNMEYYHGPFEIGVCLHACGVATDMVLEQCLSNGASFVICPCCYGGIKSVKDIVYPRSQSVQTSGVTQEEFIVIGHAADQTQKDIVLRNQGEMCMGLIDTDRLLYSEENNYTVSLSKLKPENCTTKNNLLTGVKNTR